MVPGPVSVYSSSSSQVVLRVLDTGSGVQTIEVIVAKNVNVTVPPFAAGTTAPIYVTGTKINLGSSAQIGLRVTDRCGNVTVFDPVDATVSGGSRPEGVLLAPVYHDESLVQITNHGLTELSLTVNGHLIVVKNIGKDEVRTIDIGWALNAASDNNTVLVVPKGPKKSSAHVFIYPPPILVGQEESAPKKIRQVKTATIVQLP